MTTFDQPRRESTEDRRSAIAAAARALVVEKGFEGLRTRDIADRVGINVATLHYHVPTKEALIELVCESARDEFIAQSRATPKEGMTGAQRLHHEFLDYYDLVENHAELMTLMTELDQRARRDANIRVIFDRLRGKWLSIVVNVLTLGVRDGSLRADIDPVVTGSMIIAVFSGMNHIVGVTPALVRSVCGELERSLLNPNPSPRTQD